MHLPAVARSTLVAGFLVFMPAMAGAQGTPAGQIGPFQLPPVTVTAQKEPGDLQTLPVSVTVVSSEGLGPMPASAWSGTRPFTRRTRSSRISRHAN